MSLYNIAFVSIPAVIASPNFFGTESDVVDGSTFIDWIVDFFTSIWDYLNRLIEIFEQGMEGAEVILEAVGKIDEVYSFFDFYFPAGVTLCIVAILSMAICIVTFKIVTAFVG